MPRPVLINAPFIPGLESTQCREFYERLKSLLLGYIEQMSFVKDGRFQINAGAMGTISEVMSLAGGAVSLPGLSHVLKVAGGALSFLDKERIKGLAGKVHQKIGGDNRATVEAYINSIVEQITRQYQSQLEQLETREEKKVASPLHAMVDLKERLKQVAGLAKDALFNDNLDVSDAQLVAQFAAARIIEYMESHCDEAVPSGFTLVPINPNRAVVKEILYVAVVQNTLHYQLLHPHGQLIEDKISEAELGCALAEPLDIAAFERHALPRMLAITRARCHTPPLDAVTHPTQHWSTYELISAVCSYHGKTGSVNRLIDEAANKVYDKLTVLINQRGRVKPWLITELFSSPGLCVENPFALSKTYYHDDATGRTHAADYGYRLATQEEANYLQYRLIQQTHYAPRLMREKASQPAPVSNQALPVTLTERQQQLSHRFNRVVDRLDAHQSLFNEVHALNQAYAKLTLTPTLIEQIKANYFLCLRHASVILNLYPEWAISVYINIAQQFTLLNEPYTAWAFYAKAASMPGFTTSREACVPGMLSAEYHHAAQYLNLLSQKLHQLMKQQQQLGALKTASIENTTTMWDHHLPDGLHIIQTTYTHAPYKPHFNEWVSQHIDEMQALYQTFPDKIWSIGTRLADAYMYIGQQENVNAIYATLEPILSTQTTTYLTRLEATRQSDDVQAFHQLLSQDGRQHLQQYATHHQWERGCVFIHQVLEKASQWVYPKPDIHELIQDTPFSIVNHEVRYAEVAQAALLPHEPLPIEVGIRALQQANTPNEREPVWMNLLNQTLNRQVSYLGHSPCAFTILHLKPFSTHSCSNMTLRLLLDVAWESLMPIDQMYFNVLLAAMLDVMDNMDARWEIDRNNQLLRQGLSIDRHGYQAGECLQWSASHVHTPKTLVESMVQQWGETRFAANTLVTPVAVYTNDEATSLFSDYVNHFTAQHPSLYITAQCIAASLSPLTIQVQDVAYPLSPFVTNALLNSTHTGFKPKIATLPGNHTVLPAGDYFIKLWPEHPGRSYACADLAERLLGGGIVKSTAHLLTLNIPNQPPKHICAEFIEAAKGETLFDWLNPLHPQSQQPQPEVLQQNLAALSQLSAAEFTKHLLLSICFHLEDESPKNIFFNPHTQTLTKIDVERAFLGQVKKNGAHNKQLVVKSILFCMDNMQDPLDEATIRHFVSLDLFHEMDQWLKNLEQENARHRSIFEPHVATLYQPYTSNWGIKTPNIDSSLMGLVFPDSLLSDILERLLAMQTELRFNLHQQEQLTGLDLLRAVSANVYGYYAQLFAGQWQRQADMVKNKLALARFNYVTKGLYQGNTLLSMKTSVEIEGEYTELELRDILGGQNNSPTAARRSLRQYRHVSEEAALRELKKGNPFLFRWLQQDHQVRVLQQLTDAANTTTLTLDAQRTLLNVLADLPLRSLSLTPFKAVLDDRLLERLIVNTGHHIQNLNLADCQNLSQDSLYLIAEYCPNLEVLEMSGISNLQRIIDKPTTLGFGGQKLQFAHSKTLIFKGAGIQQIFCPHPEQFPQLRSLDVSNCSSLQTIEMNVPALKTIHLEHCLVKSTLAFKQYPWLVGLSASTTEQTFAALSCIDSALALTTGQVASQALRTAVVKEILAYFNVTLTRRTSESLPVLTSMEQRERDVNVRLAILKTIAQITTQATQEKATNNILQMVARQINPSPSSHPLSLGQAFAPTTPLNAQEVNALLQKLSDADVKVRFAALETLCNTQTTAELHERIFKALLEERREVEWHVREMSIITLRALLIPNSQHLAHLIQQHTDKSPTRPMHDSTSFFKALKTSEPVKSTASPSRLLALFVHVARGEQDEAEAILRIHPEYLLQKRGLTDYSGRSFIEIGIFQYALWALDSHMWRMMLSTIPQNESGLEIIKALLAQYDAWEARGVTYEFKGQRCQDKHFDFTPLTTALKTYVDNYESWTGQQCQNHWCKIVGGAQLEVPAHVAQEYCQPDRSFDPCPNFKEKTLPRGLMLKHWDTYKDELWWPGRDNKLGVDFGIYRGGAAGAARGGERAVVSRWGGGRKCDLAALTALCKVRTSEVAELKVQLLQATQHKSSAAMSY